MLDSLINPEDSIAAFRAVAYHTTGSPAYCKIASVGHPNQQGAQAYADAIIPLLSIRSLVNRNPTPIRYYDDRIAIIMRGSNMVFT